MTQRFFIIKCEPQSIESLPLVGRTPTRCDGALSIGGNDETSLPRQGSQETVARPRQEFARWHDSRANQRQRLRLGIPSQHRRYARPIQPISQSSLAEVGIERSPRFGLTSGSGDGALSIEENKMTALDRLAAIHRVQRDAALSADIETDMGELQDADPKGIFNAICDRVDHPERYAGEAKRIAAEIRSLRGSDGRII